MSKSRQVLSLSKSQSSTTLAIVVLAVVFVTCLFVAGFDNGHIIETVFAESGVDPLVIHELTHDMRHAAGFPCH